MRAPQTYRFGILRLSERLREVLGDHMCRYLQLAAF